MGKINLSIAIPHTKSPQGALRLAEQMVHDFTSDLEPGHRYPLELYLGSCIWYVKSTFPYDQHPAAMLLRILRLGEPREDDWPSTLYTLMDAWEQTDSCNGNRPVCVEWYRLANGFSKEISVRAISICTAHLSVEEIAIAEGGSMDSILTLKKRYPLVTPISIKDKLDKTVTGQEEAKISVSMAIYTHWLAYTNSLPCTCETTLIIGPTGCGKTLIAQEAAKIVGLPYIIVDSSQLSEDGWKGVNKNKILALLYEKSDSDTKAEYGIIVLDEFDKLCRPRYTNKGENYGETLQSVLLGMMDGIPVKADSGEEFKTKNLLFILTGSFSGLNQLIEKEKTKSGIGFESLPDEPVTEEPLAKVDYREYLIKLGVIPEMAGRLANITFVQSLTADEIYDALTNDNSISQKYKDMLQLSGRKLIIDSDYLKELCQKGYEQGLGVRGTRNLLSEQLRNVVYNSFIEDTSEVRLG